jgi:hypothetical protein
MNTRDVNLLNIALMGLSAAVAWEYPLELFFFAYGVLGPLHYLTEISWLKERKWFSTSGADWIVPVGVAIGLTALFVAKDVYGASNESLILFDGKLGADGPEVRLGYGDVLTSLAIGTTLGAAFVKGPRRKVFLAVAATAVLLAWMQLDPGRFFVSIFLTTLIHVFVFTWCFMLYGAMKSRSLTGYLSCAAHLGFGALMLWAPDDGRSVALPQAKVDQLASFAHVVNYTNLVLGRAVPSATYNAAAREAFVDALRFMSYAYTYHYLNWFSKTGIIRWHETTRRRLVLIGGVWSASLALYAYDWKLAFIALLALSLAHVFLEFPLNWRTFVAIGAELKDRVGKGARTASPAATPQSPAATR